MFDLGKIVRPNINRLKPYSSARDDFQGNASVFLDANENAFGSPLQQTYNRYPDPHQRLLKEKISTIKGLPTKNIFLGNGSDEAIDLLFRIFCEPKIDKVIICPPTYGMYEVSANINDVPITKVPLLPNFELDVEGILENSHPNSKLLFICSPNNPTGNSFHDDDVELLIAKFQGIVVIDEAYINYSRRKSYINLLTEYPNLVILQTFSKAWGLASLRLGMAFASQAIIELMDKVKPPYNVSGSTQQLALQALDNMEWVNNHIRETIIARNILIEELKTLPLVQQIYPADTNFLLVKVTDAQKIYHHLVTAGIIVRDRSKVELCQNCLRITVGTAVENTALINELKKFTDEKVIAH